MAANIGILCSTVALMCIPICAINAVGWEKVFSICVALIFWSGVLVACFFDWRCRAILKSQRKKKSTKLISRPAILRFAENKYIRVIDIGMVVAMFIFILILFFDIQHEWFVMTDISMMFMTFGLHCIYSGKIK